MGCDGPLTAYRPAAGAPDGRLVFDKRKSNSGVAITVPCGQCSGCKLETSRQWAVRCLHELKTQPPGTASSFVTFTYNNEHLPYGYTLSLTHYQTLLKRIRELHGPGLRFFGCGEYGEKFGRPHYHIILFNYRPPDCKLYSRGAEHNLYTSDILTETWGKGDVKIGDVTFDSCAYVARYCLKKITGPKAKAHYSIITETGDRLDRTPEFLTQSRRPGIGFDYYHKYKSELLNHDTIVINGHEVSPPRYYDKLTEKSDANMRRGLQSTIIEKIKTKRRAKAFTAAVKADNTSRRRRTKELVRAAKLKQKARIL